MVFTKMAHKYASKQLGGANNTIGFISLLLIGLILLLIDGYLVYVSYNYVMPKILMDRYYPITYYESIFLVILGHSLLR